MRKKQLSDARGPETEARENYDDADAEYGKAKEQFDETEKKFSRGGMSEDEYLNEKTKTGPKRCGREKCRIDLELIGDRGCDTGEARGTVLKVQVLEDRNVFGSTF